MKTQPSEVARWMRVLSVLAGALVATGCAATRHAVVAATGTSIGVEIAQNPANQTPHAKLGYQRAEVAIVPTNRAAGADPGALGKGAAETTNVLMELRYSGIFSTGERSGIYQRLAVGKKAVKQPGAAVMFLKDHKGEVDEQAAAALRSLITIPEVELEDDGENEDE
jgi:hypothetical protein